MRRKRNSQPAFNSAGYRTTGYNFVFPSLEKPFLNSIKKYAFPKRPNAATDSMVKFVRDGILKLMEDKYNLKALGEYTAFRDAIYKLDFSIFEYMKPHTVDKEFSREIGDIVVTSYPDKLWLQSVDSALTIPMAVAGYFYKK